MVNLIINEIVETLKTNLNFVDKITGLVKPAQLSDAQGNVKTFPIAYNTDVNVCEQSQLLDFVPDSNKISIIYFEDRGSTVTECGNQMVYITSSFTLVCWFSFAHLNIQSMDTSQITGNILKYMPVSMGNIDPLIGVYVSLTGQQANDGGVFSKYSYSEEISQYITYPYGYVALDFQAEYRVRTECFEDISICAPPC